MADRQEHVVGTDADGTPYDFYVTECDFRPTRQVRGKWAECAKCGWVAPQSEMRKRGGRWLCTRYGCATEDDK